jgi:serine/threonine protein kinase
MIRLRVLGSVDLADPRGAELTAVLAQPKRLAILVYLVVSPGFHRRDALLAMFWPELDTRRARASLNQAVGFLRKELGGRPESVIVSRGGAELGINSDGIWCDVSAFRVYIQAERYSEALDLYPGDLLPGFHSVPSSEFHEWLENERVRLRTTAVRAAREVAQVNERARHYTTAVTSARRAVELSGLDERAVRDLLTLLDRLGDRAGAINAYDEFARHLATELEAEPSAETVALVEQIRHRAVFPETSNMPQQLGPGVELNGWRVIRELERGGMATVHLALDVKHDRHVAIKELRRELSSWLEAERFLREIQITARFAHPHILPLIDSGSRNGVPYLVTPYVAGESLRARLAREGRLTPDEALRLATETAKALDYAHRHGIIHCDIKPENILLADGHAVVADFGIARAVAASDSREFVAKESEVVLGSPPYMSPELLERGPVGPTTDVYALGCVLVEMLTGAPPNPGENSSDLAESLGPGIAQLTTDCIAVNPRNRPQSAAELIRRLEILTRPTTDRPSLEGVLQQRPDRTAHRTRRRHAITWSMGALVALATLWLTTPWFGLGRSLISRGKVNAGDALLVADFKTTGPDSGVGSALAGAMRESLRESRVITLASAPAIGAGLQRMRRSRASTLDAATAVELAQRIGVKAVVTGSVTPLRSGYLVTAELIAAFSGDELAAFQESAGASDSLIPAVDRLARRLRVTIGESLKSISADPPLAQVTTASLNALKKYTEANQANAIEGDYPKAVRLLKEAVALDSTFGSAYRDLAVTTLNSGVHEEEAPEFEEKAYQLRDRMTERERLVTVASYYGSGGPHPDARKSLDGLTVVVDRYPEMGNFLNQGIAYREVRDFAREDSAYRHAIAASGGVVGGAFKYFNLVRAELNLGHISGAREALRVAAARFPGDARIEQEKRNIAYAEGNADFGQGGLPTCARREVDPGPARGE